jgi:MFS family permease
MSHTEGMAESEPSTLSGAWAPFRFGSFAVLWTAGFVSNIGTWIFNVATGWVMADLTDSAVMVSLVQAASSLPAFLLALPAGALGDIADRRRILLSTQATLAVVLAAFTALLAQGALSPWLLLTFITLLGVGSAFSAPAWHAILPRLVPKEHLPSAVALNGVSMNAARAVGPAIGGLIITYFGVTPAAAVNAVSYLAVVAALLWWRPGSTNVEALPREQPLGAMQAGLRFAVYSDALKATLIRCLAFVFPAAAYWALLPLIARDLLHGDANTFARLLGSLGLGAVAAAAVLPLLRGRFGPNGLAALGSLGTAGVLAALGHSSSVFTAYAGSFLAGVCWISVLSSFNISVQVAVPEWIRARGLAIYQMVFWGGMSLGSVVWGQVASHTNLVPALTGAAAMLALLIPLTWAWRLNLGEHQDYAPTGHWGDLRSAFPVAPEQGPVLITIDYQIAPAGRAEFLRLMNELGQLRRRDGALTWYVFEDTDQANCFTEVFMDSTWVAHAREHARVSQAHQELEVRLRALQVTDHRRRVKHYVAPVEEL